jgi:predicted DNA-binding transcriptional regulator YafY
MNEVNEKMVIVEERREKLLGLANKIGFRNLDKKILAEQFHVSERMIYKDIEQIKKHFKFDNLRDAQIEIHVANNKALQEALKQVTVNPSAENIKTLIEASKNYERYLESFRIKEKIADRHEHRIDGYRFELVELKEGEDTTEQEAGPGDKDSEG